MLARSSAQNHQSIGFLGLVNFKSAYRANNAQNTGAHFMILRTSQQWRPEYLYARTASATILPAAEDKRNNFASSRGLSQHQQQNAACNKRMKQSLVGIAHDFMPTVKVNRTYGRNLTRKPARKPGSFDGRSRQCPK